VVCIVFAQVNRQVAAAEAACGLPVPASRRHWRMHCDLAAEEASLALVDDRCGCRMQALCLRLQARALTGWTSPGTCLWL
jgi:hypothetical protein